LLLALALPGRAEPTVAELIVQLNDDSPARRDEASAALRKRGAAAEEALKEALANGPPETQGRAGRILREIAVDLALEKLEAEELKKLWDDVESGGPARRRLAIRKWVDACGRKPETVEALLGLLEIDPGGVAGDAACEALNRLCAPRLTGIIEARGSGSTFLEGEALEGMMKGLLGDRFRITPGARALVETVHVRAKNDITPESELTQLRRYCGWASVVWRMDDDAGTVSIELPAESLAVWRPWWNALKEDRLALMDLGLLAAPKAAEIKDEEMKSWLEALGSGDGRHARVARRVLKEMTGEQAAKLIGLARRPDAPGALRDLARRLSLREKGRLSWTSGARNDMRVWLAGLDASFAREVVPGALTWWLVVPEGGADIGYVYIGPFDGVMTLHRVDLTGKTPPVPVAEPGERVSISADGTRMLAKDDDKPGSLRLVDLATGKSTPLPDLPAMHAEWAPDGRRFSILDWKASTLHIHDVASGGTVACGGVSVSNWGGWAPDGSRWAFFTVLENGPDGRRQVETADAATGTSRVAIGPLEAGSMGRPAHSPDGKTLAVGWLERGAGKAAVALYDVATGKTRIERTPAVLKDNTIANASVRWSSDNAFVLWTYSDGMPGQAFWPAKGEWREARPAKFGSEWIPGTSWILEEQDGDVVLYDLFEDFRINLTESGEEEHSPKFVPHAR
jgi:hypothetical protein